MKNILFNKSIILGLFFALFFVQCNIKEKSDSNNVRKIVVSPLDAITLKATELFDSVEIVALESDDNKVFVKPEKLITYNNHFFFKSRNELTVFDSIGKFCFKIDKKGPGPGEYISFSDYQIEKDGSITINDGQGRKLIRYSNTGNFIKEIKHNLFSTNFFILNKNYVINSGPLINSNTKCRVNIICEDNPTKITGFLEESDNNRLVRIFEYTNFSYFKDTLSYSYCSSNTIYYLKDKTAKPRLYVDFGKNTLPESYFAENNDVVKFVSNLKETEYASIIDGYQETDKFLFFLYCFKGKRSFVFWNKTDNLTYNYNKLNDDLLFPDIMQKTSYDLLPILMDNNYLYISMESNTFKDLYEKLKEKLSNKEWEIYKKNHQFIEKTYSNLSPEDNAIILKYRFKKHKNKI